MCKYPEGAQHSCGKVLRRGVKHQVINGDSQWQPFIQEYRCEMICIQIYHRHEHFSLERSRCDCARAQRPEISNRNRA